MLIAIPAGDAQVTRLDKQSILLPITFHAHFQGNVLISSTENHLAVWRLEVEYNA